MTNEPRSSESTELPGSVTGVARGGHGTATALEDTQLYDVSDFSPVIPAAAAPEAAPEVEPGRAVSAPVDSGPIDSAPVVAAPAAAAVASAPAPRTRAPSRTAATSRTRRVGAPVAGLAGFALAAGLAILIGAALGGVPTPDGAAGGAETPGHTTAAPAETDAPDDDDTEGDGGGNGKGNNGNGNGRGNGNDD